MNKILFIIILCFIPITSSAKRVYQSRDWVIKITTITKETENTKKFIVDKNYVIRIGQHSCAFKLLNVVQMESGFYQIMTIKCNDIVSDFNEYIKDKPIPEKIAATGFSISSPTCSWVSDKHKNYEYLKTGDDGYLFFTIQDNDIVYGIDIYCVR
jgi:hypothetical protein